MNGSGKLNRRGFLKTGAMVGGGLLLAVHIPLGRRIEAHYLTGSEFQPNAFLAIAPDGTVTVTIGKSEMGQGVTTSLPMLVAEELEANWEDVRVEFAPVAPAYNHTQFGPIMVTGGSTSVRSTWEQLRTAGAAARLMLVDAAARVWGVEPGSCRAQQGYVIHQPTARRLAFGHLAERAAGLEPPTEIVLKDPKDFTLIGTSRARLDTPAKCNGSAVFGIDVMIPGMLVAVVARPPVFGGKVKSFDDSRARKVAGVRHVVQIDRGVAVVADGYWAALQGRDALQVSWDDGPLVDLDTEKQFTRYAETAKSPGLAAAQRGDAAAALKQAAKTLEAVYEVPYLAHAPMEPLNCVAHVRPESCEIWVGTQMQTTDRNAAAEICGLPPEKVSLTTTYLGGGFGRRAVPDSHFVREAVQVSKAVGAPVKVQWSREDDIRGGWYRPAAYNALRGGVDADGMPLAWTHTIVNQSIAKGTPFEQGMIQEGIDQTSVEGAADSPYAIPNVLVDYHMAPAGVPVLWWRSVGHSFTAFVKECFLDELAHLGGQDPYALRLALLKEHPRMAKLLQLAAEKSGWGSALPEGRGRGIAVHESFGSLIAQVAEVSVDEKDRIRVHRVVCAVDCGRVVNPDTVEAQMESGIVFGLSAALHGAITFKQGRVEQSNFHDYEVVRIDAMPVVEVHILESGEALGGIGEPGTPPIAPAVANAVFAASGLRLRTLPMTPAVVKAARQATS